ncbi:hypothetical protein [Anaerosalibacter bizertensis]
MQRGGVADMAIGDREYIISKSLKGEEVYEILKSQLKTTKVDGINYDHNFERVEISANYCKYIVTISGNKLKISTKWNNKWLYIGLALLITSYFLILPLAGIIALIILTHSEQKEIRSLIYQILNIGDLGNVNE